jgi:hypothetical protein
VDSARAVATETSAFLRSRGLLHAEGGAAGRIELRVTDVPKSFGEMAARFLGGDVPEVEQVDL